VLAVIAKFRFLVTAAMAEIGCKVSLEIYFNGPWQFENLETYNGRIGDWPLSSSPNAIIEAILIRIISAVCVCKKQSIDSPSIKELGEINPVLELSLIS
jgi:hypothetical protein